MSAQQSSLFGSLLRNVDEGLSGILVSAADGMSNYIMPVAWVMFGIGVLMWALMIMEGKTSSPINDWLVKGLVIILIFQASSSMYHDWVYTPLYNLPTGLINAVTQSKGGVEGSLNTLSSAIDQLILGIAQAMIEAFKDWNFGGAFILLLCIILIALAGSLLEVACVFNIIYAKLGISLVLGVGPFFVICLAFSPIRGYFFSWLNTVLYFVFLAVITTLMALLFVGVANKFMMKLAEAVGANNLTNLAASISANLKATMSADQLISQTVSNNVNIFSIAMQMVLIFVPMFFVALEARTLVSSMTSGSGGSFGSGVASAVNMGLRAGMGRGKSPSSPPPPPPPPPPPAPSPGA